MAALHAMASPAGHALPRRPLPARTDPMPDIAPLPRHDWTIAAVEALLRTLS